MPSGKIDRIGSHEDVDTYGTLFVPQICCSSLNFCFQFVFDFVWSAQLHELACMLMTAVTLRELPTAEEDRVGVDQHHGSLC